MLFDAVRGRAIPIAVYRPDRGSPCLEARNCSVAIVSTGYGGTAAGYSFLARRLNPLGYLVVGVQHDLASDEPMPLVGDVREVRSPYWRRGVESLEFVLRELPERFPGFNWEQVVLVGHSNGGDISAWFATARPSRVAALVTFDHRRFPLPRRSPFRTLTVRSADQQADAGVLPPAAERLHSKICVVAIPGAAHNDMHDGGPAELRERIAARLVEFLGGDPCLSPTTDPQQKELP